MKILHIAPIGKNAEGIGTVLSKLVPEQKALGVEVKVISCLDGATKNEIISEVITKKKPFREYINRWRPDVVLFHSLFEMPCIMMAKVLLELRIPYAIQMHGAMSVANYSKGRIKKWIANKLWFDSFVRNAKTLVFLNEAEHQNCLSTRINPKYAILPNGCENKVGSYTSHEIKNPVNIVYIGRIAFDLKGLDYLTESLSILKNLGRNDFNLSIYGNEKDSDVDLLKHSLSNFHDIASFKGGVYGVNKDNVLKEADAFILTSKSEGMPMSVLEALSFGVPCILTPGTNMADEVVDAGAGWKTELSAESIADTIKIAIVDLQSSYLQYHQAAYNMSKRYNWKLIAKQHINVMNAIADIERK